MNKLFSYAMAGILGLIIGVNVDAQTKSQRDTSEVIVTGQKDESNWFTAETEHFTVYSDTNHESVSKLLNSLERFHFLLSAYTKNEKKDEFESKIVYYYLSTSNGFKIVDPQTPPNAIGLYASCSNRVQAFGVNGRTAEETKDDLSKLHIQNDDLSQLFQAYARHYLFKNSDLRSPKWFIDGFANYFSTARFSDNQLIIGKTPSIIQDYYVFLGEGNAYLLDYKDILEDNDSEGHGGKAALRLEFETKSWLLTHFIVSSTENLAHFRKYVQLRQAKGSVEKSFETAFGFPLKKLSRTLWEYRNKTQKSILLNVENWPAIDVSFNQLPKSATDLVLLDAAINTCPSTEIGNALLLKIQAEAKKYPKSNYAQLSLARAEVEFGSAEKAISLLNQLIEQENSNDEVYYWLGKAKIRNSLNQSGDAQKQSLSEAKTSLLHAMSLNRRSAEAMFAYFQAGVLAEEHPKDETLGAATLAWQKSREVGSYSRGAALVYAYLGNKNKANDILNNLTENTLDPKLASWAQNWQQQLSASPSQADILKEMRTDINTTTKEWTMATQYTLQDVKMDAALKNAQDFIQQQQENERNNQMQGNGNSASGLGNSRK